VLEGYVLFQCEDTEPDEHVYYFRLLSVHGGTLNRMRLDPRAEVPWDYPFPQGGPYYMSFTLQWQRMRRLTWPKGPTRLTCHVIGVGPTTLAAHVYIAVPSAMIMIGTSISLWMSICLQNICS
jgi:hypothetical protein